MKVHSISKPATTPAAAASVSLVMGLKKSTKGTHVYEAVQEDAFCTQVYLRKANFPDAENPPKSITLSVTFG